VYCGNKPTGKVDPNGQSALDYLTSYGVDLTVGGMLVLLGYCLVRYTERSALGYVLGALGVGLGGLGAAMAIKAFVDWAGPIFRDYVEGILDAASGKVRENMERRAQEQAGSLTERVRSVICGQQMITAGYTLQGEM